MKRKTNLFYTDGPDSKFLTFSNYTELLTGNFLSTNTKIYPSRFLCLNIQDLDKNGFIKDYLIGYYENKLAFLRDYYIENNYKPENYLYPLLYLFDAISKYDINYEITYFGDITEQDYNGTYTDTICIVDFAKYYTGSIYNNPNNNPITDNNEIPYYDPDNNIINDPTKLYGWENKLNNIEEFRIDPKFDGEYDGKVTYSILPNLNTLTITKNNSYLIKFNVIIPLFDLTNIKPVEYISDNNVQEESINLLSEENKNKYIPLGIWFADKEIVLEKDVNTGYSQTWSLMISSQFKPFPYSLEITNNVDDLSTSITFPTFAQILSNQKTILEGFSKTHSIIHEFREEIESLKSEIKTLKEIINNQNN